MADVNLPPATGSGKGYAVANASGADVALVADITGTADSIDGSASKTMVDGEALDVVDYKANNWVII